MIGYRASAGTGGRLVQVARIEPPAAGKGAAMAAKKTASAAKRAGAKTPRRRRGITVKPVSLLSAELGIERPEGDLGRLGQAVRADGGAVLGAYREPLGGHALLLVSLPIEKVGPTAFQRDLSDAHLRKLTRAMDKTRRFLDPPILVRSADRIGPEDLARSRASPAGEAAEGEG